MSTTCKNPNEIRRRRRRFVNPLTLPQQFLPGLKPSPKDVTALLMTGRCNHCQKPVMPKNKLCMRCVERQTALASMKPFLREHPDPDVTDEVLEALATCEHDGESAVVDAWIEKKKAEIRRWCENSAYVASREQSLAESPAGLEFLQRPPRESSDIAGDDSAR